MARRAAASITAGRASRRVIWKGAVTFGLVYIPVTLYPGAKPNNLDFDWLDRRDMAPIGYQRFNKRTGKLVEAEHIARGYAFKKGEYVLLSDADFQRANRPATQTVEIVSFAQREEIGPFFFETPYYLEPGARGENGYALLREALQKTAKVAIAKVVLHTRQHMAAVIAHDDILLLNTMRFATEILPRERLSVPPVRGRVKGVQTREMDMALRLIDEMSEPFRPADHRDTYRDDLLKRIEAKVKAGDTESLSAPDEPVQPQSAKVIDLVALLKESLERKGKKDPSDTRAETRGARAPANRTAPPAARSPTVRRRAA